MALFLISFLLVFTASYFVAISFENKSFLKFCIYLLLAVFANVVLTFEVLSLFSAIYSGSVLVMNTVFAGCSAFFWYKKRLPQPEFVFKLFFKSLWRSLMLDKYLFILSIAFLFMCGVSLWLISFMPVVNPDAEAYHVLRSLFWISQHNLNHFNFADIRALVLPINSEILYAWLLIFLKKQMWFGVVSFSGFLLALVSLWGLLSNIGISMRRKLWILLILSSFSSVIVQISGTETDIIIAGLVSASMYLFWEYLKKDSKIHVFMSALSYALAVGTKTPAIILVPAVGLWMTGMAVYYKKKDFYRPLLEFLGFSFLNFMFFSSYNYILNFIDYGNIAGSKPFMAVHANQDGILALPANFIKYVFMFFDFTGFRWNEYVGNYIYEFRESILAALGLSGVSEGLYSIKLEYLNQTLLEPLMGMGILGFLVFLPCWIYSLIKPVFSRKKQSWMIFSFAAVLFLGIAVMSVQIEYMIFSIRFLTAFCVVSAPVLAYSYCSKNNPVKFIIVFFALFYFIFVSTNLWGRSAYKISKYFKRGATISQVREIAHCSGFYNAVEKNPDLISDYPVLNEACLIRDKIREFDRRNKILFLSNVSESLLAIKLLQFDGYDIDFDIVENSDNIDFGKYNLLFTIGDLQGSTNVIHFDRAGDDFKYIIDGAVCGYFDTKDKLISSGGKYPYKTVCSLEPLFYKFKGYKPYSRFFYEEKEDGKTVNVQFAFYENTKNPVIGPQKHEQP